MREQPGTREFPIALQSGDRDIEQTGDFGFRKAAEVSEFDDGRCARIELRKPLKCFVKRERIGIARQSGGVEVPELDADVLPSALFGVARSGVIDQDAAHLAGGDHKEVLAIAPRDDGALLQAKIQLVDERGGLQRVSGGLLLQIVRGEMAQVCVGSLDGIVGCAAVAFDPSL